MKTSNFDYFLPQELIAQTPISDRSASRLMVVNKETGEISDRHFFDIIEYLKEGDCLVLNDSKVFPARIYGQKEETGARIEFLLHKKIDGKRWEVMARPGKRLKIGTKVVFSERLSASVLERGEDGLVKVEFAYDGDLFEILAEIGSMPLPPYIKKRLEDKNRYQTVYASHIGSSAAPTAGFHFTSELLDRIKAIGVNVVFITLHVGLGTFLPVSADEITEHKMHTELYSISEEAASMINEAKQRGSRVICTGTTCVRTLESSARKNGGKVAPEIAQTDIFIYPGFDFLVTDGLITNFHLPKSTLIMLVSAFYDKDKVIKAYEHAVKEKYRFFSFGDASFFY